MSRLQATALMNQGWLGRGFRLTVQLTFGVTITQTVTLSSKVQLVIPSHVRATANLHAGDSFEVRYLNGEIRLKPVVPARTTTLDELTGCLSELGKLPTSIRKPQSDTQVHAAIKARLKVEDAATFSNPGRRSARDSKSS